MTAAETFTVNQLAEAVKANDADRVRQILDAQPELLRTDMAYENEHQVLHYAVYGRLPEMVRLLMQRGADARKGVWPHRAATTGLVIARDRGDSEIVAIIEEQENLRKSQAQSDPKSAAREQLMKAFDRNDEDAILRILEADPLLIEAYSWRLHAAACKGFERLAAWLLDHGSDVNSLQGDRAPLDMAGKLPPGLIGPQETLGELLLWSGAGGGHPEIVRLALPIFNLPRNYPRWWWMLWHPLFRSLECFKLVLQHCNPDVSLYFGRTILHDIVGMYGRDRNREGRDSTGDAIGFASAVLDAGGRLDVRDDLLKSTPLGWACRWGLTDLVKLFLYRGADPVESDAESWATPRAWAEKGNHSAVLALLASKT
jgi:hypothetical protein